MQQMPDEEALRMIYAAYLFWITAVRAYARAAGI